MGVEVFAGLGGRLEDLDDPRREVLDYPFPRARMTVITVPEVDMERIAGLFSIL